MKESYFKRHRGVQFFDVSDSEDEEPRNVGAAEETQAPRGEAAVMYALSQLSVLSLHPCGVLWVETLNWKSKPTLGSGLLLWDSAAPK